jgi:hypothetical protein
MKLQRLRVKSRQRGKAKGGIDDDECERTSSTESNESVKEPEGVLQALKDAAKSSMFFKQTHRKCN